MYLSINDGISVEWVGAFVVTKVEITHRIKLTCIADGDSKFVDLNYLPCDQQVCGSIDLTGEFVGSCEIGLIEYGNKPDCIVVGIGSATFEFTDLDYQCKGCVPGETGWTDNFDQYTEGEDLRPYGYFGAAPPTAVGGQCQNEPAVLSGSYVWRVSPFDPYTKQVQSFFCNLGTADTAIALMLGQVASGLGSFISTYAVMSFNDSGQITYDVFGGSPFIDPTNTGAVGDQCRIDARKISYIAGSLRLAIDFYLNGLLTYSAETTLVEGMDIGNGFELNFCGMGYGVVGGPSGTGIGLSDNWNMVSTDEPDDCLYGDIYFCATQNGIEFSVISSEVVGNQKNYVIEATCVPFPANPYQFNVSLPCDSPACASIDLSSVDMGGCGQIGIVKFGNNPACCNDPPPCIFGNLYICPVPGFAFEVVSSVVENLAVTHRVKVTCDPPDIGDEEFFVTLPCQEISCRTYDLTGMVLVPCGSPGIITLGNDPSCCP